MSGSLIDGAAAVASQVFSGGGVIVGSVSLQGFEVPEKVNFGGEHRVVMHKMPGGYRVLDAMGPDDSDIEWEGMMIAANAAQRAQMLDQMRISGSVISLIFGVFSRNVIIREFVADYRRSNWIGSYRIKCVVVSEQYPQGSVGIAAQSSNDAAAACVYGFVDTLCLLGAVSAVASGAITAISTSVAAPGIAVNASIAPFVAAVPANAAIIEDALAAVQVATYQAGPFVAGQTSTIATLQGIIAAAESALATVETASEGVISAVQASATQVGVIGGASVLCAVTAAAGLMANAIGAGAYIGRTSANLTNEVA